jgi:hypothetical protein
MTMGFDLRQFELLRQQTKQQADEQRRKVEAEAKKAHDALRGQQSEIESEAEARINELREAESLEQRQRGLPSHEYRELGTEEQIAKINEARATTYGTIKQSHSDIDKALSEDIGAISKAESDSLAEIDRVEAEAIAQIKAAEAEQAKFEVNNVKLDTGEYVDKAMYDSLTAEFQAKLKELGVAGYNQWVVGLATQAEAGAEAIKKSGLSDYASVDASGQTVYDLAGYMRDNPDIKPSTLLELGFTQEGIDAAVSYNKDYSAFVAQNIKIDYVNPNTGENEWVDKGFFEGLDTTAQNYLNQYGLDRYNGWVDHYNTQLATSLEANYVKLAYTDPQTGESQYIQKTDWNKLNADAQAYINQNGIAAYNEQAAVSLAALNTPKKWYQTVWEFVTPWNENAGETFITYLKGIFTLTPDAPTQEMLKAQYDAEQNAPLWSKILFGPTVIYDKDKDKYLELVIMEYPSGKTGVTTAVAEQVAARVKTATIPINWNEFVSSVKTTGSSVNWKALTQAINAGEIRSASQAAEWAASQARWFPKVTPPKLTPAQQVVQAARTQQAMADAAEAAARARAASSIGYVATVPQPNVPAIQWVPFAPSQLTVAKMKELISSWLEMKPSAAITQMTGAGLATIAIAVDPVSVHKIFTNATTTQQANLTSALSLAVSSALRQGQLAKAQTLAKTQTQAMIELQTMAQQATELANSLANQGMTQAQIQTQLQTQLQTRLQNITSTQTRTMVETQVEPLTKQIAETVTPAPTPVLTPTPVPTPAGETTTPPKEPIKPLIPIIKLPDGSSRPMTPDELKGAVAWKQGFIYIMIYPPYGDDNVAYSRKPFPGVKMVEGARSAYRTVVKLGGTLPPRILHNMGIMDVKITTITGGKPKISFERETGLQTLLYRQPRRKRLAKTTKRTRQSSTPTLKAVRL